MLEHYDDEGDVLEHLERHKATITARLRELDDVADTLDRIISSEREARQIMSDPKFDIEEKTVDTVLMAGVRMKGKYSDCGRGFARIGKQFGRHICGKPFLLHYDTEYKEDDAEFEACMPIRKGGETEGISVRELPGGRCVSLLHKGPYEQLGRSYARVLEYIREKGYETVVPSREVYIKGPGMIFKGNPRNYLTEIQMMIKPA
jgi:effector-binding domain-containing protein